MNNENSPVERTLFERLKRIQALAEIGLEYSNSNYDQDRYDEIQEISAEI